MVKLPCRDFAFRSHFAKRLLFFFGKGWHICLFSAHRIPFGFSYYVYQIPVNTPKCVLFNWKRYIVRTELNKSHRWWFHFFIFLMFTPIPGKKNPSWRSYFFQIGWFNHQLESHWYGVFCIKKPPSAPARSIEFVIAPNEFHAAAWCSCRIVELDWLKPERRTTK